MPWGDGTGPLGLGPRTGRAAGYGAGYPVPGYVNSIPGRGFWGWFGRGWRHCYYATGLPGWMRAGIPAFGKWNVPFSYEPNPKEESEILKEQSETSEKYSPYLSFSLIIAFLNNFLPYFIYSYP